MHICTHYIIYLIFKYTINYKIKYIYMHIYTHTHTHTHNKLISFIEITSLGLNSLEDFV